MKDANDTATKFEVSHKGAKTQRITLCVFAPLRESFIFSPLLDTQSPTAPGRFCILKDRNNIFSSARDKYP